MRKDNSIRWVTAVLRNHTPLFIDILIFGQKKQTIKRNTNFDFGFSNILKDNLRLAYDKAEIEKARLKIKNMVSGSGIEIFEKFADACFKSSNNLIERQKKVENRIFPNSLTQIY